MKGNFRTLCWLKADPSHLPLAFTASAGDKPAFYAVSLRVILKFDVAELKGQLAWIEDGVEKRSVETATP